MRRDREWSRGFAASVVTFVHDGYRHPITSNAYLAIKSVKDQSCPAMR